MEGFSKFMTIFVFATWSNSPPFITYTRPVFHPHRATSVPEMSDLSSPGSLHDLQHHWIHLIGRGDGNIKKKEWILLVSHLQSTSDPQQNFASCSTPSVRQATLKSISSLTVPGNWHAFILSRQDIISPYHKFLVSKLNTVYPNLVIFGFIHLSPLEQLTDTWFLLWTEWKFDHKLNVCVPPNSCVEI